MNLIHSILQINKLIFKFLHKDHNNIDTNNDKTIYKCSRILDKTYHNLENIYYNQVLYPKLENIWQYEKESFLLCITCIIHTIMSCHTK